MFYEKSIDLGFRFGDVVSGFLSTTPVIDNPSRKIENNNFSIEVSALPFCVILTPCCSISDKIISLTPLLPVRNSFFNNPYFKEDLTRINRKMPAEKAIPPIAFEKMPDNKKREIYSKGSAYTLLELFVYEGNELLPSTTINMKKTDNITTNYYMIDFRNSFKVNCSKIITPINVPSDLKILQLSVKTRSELRNKITHFYGRLPKEDLID